MIWVSLGLVVDKLLSHLSTMEPNFLAVGELENKAHPFASGLNSLEKARSMDIAINVAVGDGVDCHGHLDIL